MVATSGILVSLALIVLAGLLNGSFALPTKSMKKWEFENIWFIFVIFCFLIAPWLVMFALGANPLPIYAQATPAVVYTMILGGIFFGIGQCAFAVALNTIGLGLGFVINIGLSIILGTLMPYLHLSGAAATTSPLTTTLIVVALVIAATGLLLYYKAGKMRDNEKGGMGSIKQASFTVGLIAAIIAGLSSAGQNYSFSVSSSMQQIALHHGMSSLAASVILWPGFLACGSIPYALYMIVQLNKNKTWGKFSEGGHLSLYSFFTVLMTIGWYGSLLLYSKASQLIGTLGPVIGWPLFMILIILTSNFWGWRYQEWANCSKTTNRTIIYGILAMLVAVVILGYTAYLI